MESSSAGGRNGGLPSKAGVNGDDHIYDSKSSFRLCGAPSFDRVDLTAISVRLQNLALSNRSCLPFMVLVGQIIDSRRKSVLS